MTRSADRRIDRRALVRGAGAALLGVSLAGCSIPGGGEGEEDGEGGDEGDEGGEGGGEGDEGGGEEGDGGEEEGRLRPPE